MDKQCLVHGLSPQEADTFERDGYLVVEDALPEGRVSALREMIYRHERQIRSSGEIGPYEMVHRLGCLDLDQSLLELVDWPQTFPKVWGILGWNIQLYHTHVTVTPPRDPNQEVVAKTLGWHQDTGRVNLEMEGNPRPRLSVKVAYFLTDTTSLGVANMYVLPGSHLKNSLQLPKDGVSNPTGATAIRVKAGTALIFDRRLWHAASPNDSTELDRVMLAYGYSYRWLKPRDDMPVGSYLADCDPIRRQLLGAGSGFSFTSPGAEDVPLRGWLARYLGEDAVAD